MVRWWVCRFTLGGHVVVLLFLLVRLWVIRAVMGLDTLDTSEVEEISRFPLAVVRYCTLLQREPSLWTLLHALAFCAMFAAAFR
jgi:hypothetical protein